MKRGHHPSTPRRHRKQKLKGQYMKLREDAQLEGLIPTEPAGAVRDERVPSVSQSSQQLPALVRQGLKQSWATPDSAKPVIVAALLEPFFERDVTVDKDGNTVEVVPDRDMLLKNAKLLRDLDQTQYERDNPDAAGKAKGGGMSLSVQANMEAVAVLRGMLEDDQGRGLSALPSPVEPGPLGYSRFDGEVEVGAASTSD